MTPRLFSFVLIGIFLVFPRVAAASNEKLARDFQQPLTTITIENPDGNTEVQTWPEAMVRVAASRPSARDIALDSEIVFDASVAGHLRISVKPQDAGNPVRLTVYIPGSVHLAVRSIKGSVTIIGVFAGVSAYTDSGKITLHLPEDSNSDLSLRAIEGSIETKLPLKMFGRTDGHTLDARTGHGGSTVIARTSRGSISVLPVETSRAAPPVKASDVPNKLDRSGTSRDGAGLKASFASDRGGILPGEDVLKLEARLVNLNVSVAGANGKTLPTLKKEDFVVYEDNVQQDISYFEPLSAPLNMVLLLDLSGSTEHKIKVMKKAAQKFVDSLKPTDHVAVAGFTRRFFIISNFTTDHRLLKDRIGDIKNRHSGTAYYDAMWSTLDLLDEANATRKAIVVLTDGVDNSLDHPDNPEFDAKHSFAEILARVEEADATIYPIYLDTEYETLGSRGRNGHEAYVTARSQLQTLADQTGAVMFKAERAEDLEGVYQQVSAELHSLYSLAYTPKLVRTDGKWRKIGIAVTLPFAKVRTKRGYYAR